ncbi:MAG: hypothetical protein Q8L37_06465 [Candidatus Gottesmanbacteria bacterium]|nr:hypothetical protein [Candidatus Gottesmanbacteria bacterium]
MKIVQSSETKKVIASPTTSIWEFTMEDTKISGAITEINGRYPEQGFAINEVCKEIAFVVSGSGHIVTSDQARPISVGDLIFLDKGESFAWEGTLTLFMATTPKFDPRQHVIKY